MRTGFGLRPKGAQMLRQPPLIETVLAPRRIRDGFQSP
jgi:hypothetical protein